MKLVNRSAVVIRRREPYFRWAAAVFGDPLEDLTDLRDTVSVYLVPPDPAEEQESAPLESIFSAIFENELENWCTDRGRWPETRDLTTFRQWFEVTAESIVLDIAPGLIRAQSY